MTFLVPIPIFIFLLLFTILQWSRNAKKSSENNNKHKDNDQHKDYDQHNERIYKDFEFFVKVFIALVGAMGFVRFNYYCKNHEIARQAMQGIGAIALLTMVSLSIFIICHQGSKISRWGKVEWKDLFYWQELWMLFSMYLFASTLWIVSNIW